MTPIAAPSLDEYWARLRSRRGARSARWELVDAAARGSHEQRRCARGHEFRLICRKEAGPSEGRPQIR